MFLPFPLWQQSYTKGERKTKGCFSVRLLEFQFWMLPTHILSQRESILSFCSLISRQRNKECGLWSPKVCPFLGQCLTSGEILEKQAA